MANPDPDFPAGDFPAPEGQYLFYSALRLFGTGTFGTRIFFVLFGTRIFFALFGTRTGSDGRTAYEILKQMNKFQRQQDSTTQTQMTPPQLDQTTNTVQINGNNENIQSATESADRCEPSFLPPRLISVDRLINQKLYVNSSEFA
uniref:Uncharacterized protein n=1 Tax=Globodera rostochiensis TaxID=31243 RepID=A0A914GXF3_GLORO